MSDAWSVAVFTSREDAPTLGATLAAVSAACGARRTTIDVLVDDNRATADAIAGTSPALGSATTVRLWLLPWRDKACAWNRYVDEIAPEADVAFFVDGYVRPHAGSLTALARALDARPAAWAASGPPPAFGGRRGPVEDGRLHGNLYALRGRSLATLRARGFRLPLGIYRNDSLIGAAIAFGADPANERWSPARIAVVADATWDVSRPPLVHPRRLVAAFRRRLRQAQGELENAAVKRHLADRGQPLATLPSTVEALVATVERGLAPAGPVGRFLVNRARRRLAAPVDRSHARDAPTLLRTWGAAAAADGE